MIRYQVRNEYGLSDPEVYAPTEKDDPEALLEGVAMAGLVGLLRQLGDLAEFAAEIFHDLHEDVMATASRGHGLMLRLQQLEAEFPAVEKAIISQTDHSNFPHEDGVEWHANLQLNQNMITTGDMPRFILDSYEECRGPPHLFTLDKFDVAGAGASLKRYSDPSFFKMEHASTMTEIDGVREKKPRKIKKRAMRWRKGETLESLLVEHSECQSTSSKDRASRKVPPRTTKLKSRHLRDSDHKIVSKIFREQLEEVILSQGKILSNYSARHYHGKFRSTESSEATYLFGELDNFSTPAQSSAKHEVTKVVPINEDDAVKAASTANIGSLFTQADDDQFLATKDGPELKDTSKKSRVEKNGISLTSERLQEGKDFKGEESTCALQLVREEKFQLAVVPVDQDDDRCRPDDIASDQDNFIDSLNMESEGDGYSEINTKRDSRAKVEADKLNCDSKEVGNAPPVQFSDLGPAIEISSGLNDSCNGTEPARVNSFSVSDSSPSVSDSKDTESDSASHRQLSGVNWTNDEEPVNDVDLMDVSSSSSVLSDDNGNCESNEYHAAVANSSDKQSPETFNAIDGLTISSNGYDEKLYLSVEHDQNFVLDGTSMISGQPKDVSQDDGDIEDPDADDLLLHSTTPNQEQIQLFKEQFEECTSLDTGTSPSRLASLPDMDPVVLMNNLGLDNVAFPEKMDTNTTLTGLDPDDIRWHLDDLDSGVAPIHSSTLNNPLHESDDDEIVEEPSLPDEDLYKHVAEDQEIISLEKGHCSIKLNTHKHDPTQGSVVPKHLSNVHGFQGLTESVSSFQDDTEAHVREMLAPSPRVLNDHTKPSLVGSPLASSTATLLGTSSSCMEHLESIETGKNLECGQILVDAEVAEGSTTSMLNDAMIPCGEQCTGGAKYTEKAEILATNSKEENSRHDVPLQSSSCREDLETIEATGEKFGSLEESREHIFKESMLQTSNLPEPIAIETSGETFSCSNDIQDLSPLHFPEESICQEKLPEETNLSAEVPCHHDLDKDGAVSLKSNTVGEQPSDVDQYLARDLSAPDSVGINPFMDPGCVLSCADPSPSMSYRPCCSEEEQDFLSELLIQHDDMGAKKDLYPCAVPIWESATPPDEAALPSEVMTEEDFKSFCHEYLEMDFTAVPAGFDNKPSSDSNDIINGYVVNELQFPCSVSVLPAGLDQERVCSKPDSQLAGCSSARDIAGEPSVPFSAEEVPDGETPGVDSDLICHESFGDEEITGQDTPSLQVELEPETHVLPGVGSDSCSWLLDSPSGNIVPVKEEQEACVNLVPHAFITEKLDELDFHLINNSVPVKLAVEARSLDELDVLPLTKPAMTQEPEVCVLDGLNSQIVSSSSSDKTVNDLDVHPMRTALETGRESEDHISGEHDSQIVTSFVCERIDELDAPLSSDAVLVETGMDVCVPGESGSPIAHRSLPNEEIHEVDCPPLSYSVLVEQNPEDHVSGDSDYSTDEKIDRPDGATSRNGIPVDLEWETCSSPELDSHIAPCPSSDDKVGQQDLPPRCNVLVESGNRSYCPPESDSQIALSSSDSGALAEISTISSTSVIPSSEENYMVSPVPPRTEPPPYVSREDPEKPPPLPPLQWRLGRPRLRFLSKNGQMSDPARETTPVLPASSQELDNSLGPLNGTAESIAPVSSQGTKERYQNSMVENNDRRVEFERSSELSAIIDVARTEYDRSFSEACENITHQGHMSLSATEVGGHLNDGKVSDGTVLHPLNPTYEHEINKQSPILHSYISDSSEHPTRTDPTVSVSEDDKTVDNHTATDGVHLYTMSSTTPGHVSENGCFQQPQHDESFPETSDNEERSSNASYEEKNLIDDSIKSGSPSKTEKHTLPVPVLEEGNSQASSNLLEQDEDNHNGDLPEDPSPSAESIVSRDHPHGNHNLETQDMHQSNPSVSWSGDESKYVSDLDGGSYVQAEQLPVMGWTVGPQMLHPNYGTLVEERRFEPEVTDHRLMRKPISMKNIPRNPLVDAVAAHDRSTMRKISELAPPTDKPKPNDINLLLEQIRSKTFDLKPASSAKQTSMRSPSRASTRNLKVSAIIEKANAIRQAVGSDDDDEDNWSDT